ncbi:MAG: AAA family ATPase, partial [Gammaproteobacteria bacterium]
MTDVKTPRAFEGMQRFTPVAGTAFLLALARAEERLSVMIWGAPGIGKSSIVAQIADELDIGLIDLRLSQLAPTDLRGLPVAGDGVSTWYPPEFLPRDGRGILFLDEINMAPPTLQGVAQQLILDRRVGSYRVPDGWMIWAAGNRKEDRASVFDMPAPLANRFIHLGVEVDFASFKAHALSQGISERIIAFLAYRPALLHRMDPQTVSWPSPRSWFMADRLLRLGLDPAPAVGPAAATEFAAYCDVYRSLPDLEQIIAGAADPEFPAEASTRYATTIGLTVAG